MKKIAYILIFAMLLTCFAACGTKETSNSGTKEGTAATNPAEPTDPPEPEGLHLSILPAKTISTGEWMVSAVRNDGTVVSYEREGYSFGTMSGWSDMVGIDANHPYLLGLRSNGTVAVAKLNESGSSAYWTYSELDWTDIVSVASGYSVCAGLRSDGTVVTEVFDSDFEGFEMSIPADYSFDQWTNIVDIGYGDFGDQNMLIGLKDDGTIVMTGSKQYVQYRLDQVPQWTDIVEIDATAFFLVGRKADGTVVIDGTNVELDVSGWTDIVDISAYTGYVLGLKADGTVVCAGEFWYADKVASWTDIVAISAGNDTVMGLKSDGTVVIAGYDNIINNDWTNVRLP